MRIEFADVRLAQSDLQIFPPKPGFKPFVELLGFVPNGEGGGSYLPGNLLFSLSLGTARFYTVGAARRERFFGKILSIAMLLAMGALVLMIVAGFMFHDHCGGFIWPSYLYPCLGSVLDEPLFAVALKALGLVVMLFAIILGIMAVDKSQQACAEIVIPNQLASSLNEEFAILEKSCAKIRRTKPIDHRSVGKIIQDSVLEAGAKGLVGLIVTPLAAEYLVKASEASLNKNNNIALASELYRAGVAKLISNIFDFHHTLSATKPLKITAGEFVSARTMSAARMTTFWHNTGLS